MATKTETIYKKINYYNKSFLARKVDEMSYFNAKVSLILAKRFKRLCEKYGHLNDVKDEKLVKEHLLVSRIAEKVEKEEHINKRTFARRLQILESLHVVRRKRYILRQSAKRLYFNEKALNTLIALLENKLQER